MPVRKDDPNRLLDKPQPKNCSIIQKLGMENKILYSPEQIEVPNSFGDILISYSKEVIRSKVTSEDLLKWSANYFASLCGQPEPYERKSGKLAMKGGISIPTFSSDDLNPVPRSTTEISKMGSPSIDFKGLTKKYTGDTSPDFKPLVLCGPSGCGKSSVVASLFGRYPGIFAYPVMHTWREKREGEVEGKDFFFVSKEKFDELKGTGQFVDVTVREDGEYAISAEEVSRCGADKCCILDVSTLAGVKLSKRRFDARFIYLRAPDSEVLMKRLEGVANRTSGEIGTLVKRYEEEELELKGEFDDCVTNTKINECADEVFTIVQRQTKGLDALIPLPF